MTTDREQMSIVWHPGFVGGEATIGSSRLTASTPASCVWAGDTPADVADWYEIHTAQVELSCWWIALHDPHPRGWKRQARKAWREWAEAWGLWAWSSNPNENFPHPGPPAKEGA